MPEKKYREGGDGMHWLAVILRMVGSLCTAEGVYFLTGDKKPGLGAGLMTFGLQLLFISLEVIL